MVILLVDVERLGVCQTPSRIRIRDLILSFYIGSIQEYIRILKAVANGC